jgi:hypothetical protein
MVATKDLVHGLCILQMVRNKVGRNNVYSNTEYSIIVNLIFRVAAPKNTPQYARYTV